MTVGRRVSQWVQDLLMDLRDIQRVRADLRFRGAQGTTGTQASFMEIFHNNGAKFDELNKIRYKKADFPSCYPISTRPALAKSICQSQTLSQHLVTPSKELPAISDISRRRRKCVFSNSLNLLLGGQRVTRYASRACSSRTYVTTLISSPRIH